MTLGKSLKPHCLSLSTVLPWNQYTALILRQKVGTYYIPSTGDAKIKVPFPLSTSQPSHGDNICICGYIENMSLWGRGRREILIHKTGDWVNFGHATNKDGEVRFRGKEKDFRHSEVQSK